MKSFRDDTLLSSLVALGICGALLIIGSLLLFPDTQLMLDETDSSGAFSHSQKPTDTLSSLNDSSTFFQKSVEWVEHQLPDFSRK